jgi:hypothetical protein
MLRISRVTLPIVCLSFLSGCGGGDADTGTGSISVRAYGESFIEDGIPADAADDGWAISFSRFEVTVQDIVVGEVALEDPDPVDVSAASDGEGHELGTVSVATGNHAEPSFTIAHIEVDGSAEKDDVTKTFNWAFDSPTAYTQCETTTSVEKDASATFQITVHADHLFYDSLVAEEPQLLFQPLADSDSDGDGEITKAELGAVDIGAYDPGNEDVDDLWSWLVAQTRTLGHVDGEGHCEASPAH